MPLPKLVAAGVCAGILGAQIVISSPISPERHGWYWPFLAYPMYAEAHTRSDSLVVPELRVAKCGSDALTTVLMTDSLAVPRNQLLTLLVIAVRAPESAKARSAEARLSRAVDAQYPGQYCTASAWVRVAYVADTSTYHVHMPMQRALVWPMNESEPR
ncbi:MAG TPA: hypothetical protein VGO46_18620 [Gemmatimonadaceae bacterium]|jgi:hypothetical protein|nr:hypothetical protein [Gemmatimonadaceae bacterium]